MHQFVMTLGWWFVATRPGGSREHAQVDISNPQDDYRESIVVVDRGTAADQYAVWRIVETPSGYPAGHAQDVTTLVAFHGQFYSDLSAALGRFVRRSELLDRCDKEVV